MNGLPPMTQHERDVFSHLWERGPSALRKIARTLGMNVDHINKIMRRLELRYLVQTQMVGRERVCTVAGWVLL